MVGEVPLEHLETRLGEFARSFIGDLQRRFPPDVDCKTLG